MDLHAAYAPEHKELRGGHGPETETDGVQRVRESGLTACRTPGSRMVDSTGTLPPKRTG